MFKEGKNLPIGLGGEAEPKEKLPAVEVNNEVAWVNKNVEMPFDLKQGEKTSLGVFLTPQPKEGEKTLGLGAMYGHWRSGFLGKAVFKDKDGRLYRDVDLKGVGWISGHYLVWSPSYPGKDLYHVRKLEEQAVSYLGRGEEPRGFLDRGFAETDKYLSERLTKLGLRTHRALAIIKLREIIDSAGEKISITEARRRGYIKTNTEPVLELRAFGTKARIQDAHDRTMLRDAQMLVAQELGADPREFSNADYFNWFAKTLGKQVSIIHNAGLYHHYLTGHNITLDCRIVDLDSVNNLPHGYQKKLEALKDDCEVALGSFMNFALYASLGDAPIGIGEEDRVRMAKEFIDSYSANINDKKTREVLRTTLYKSNDIEKK